MNKAVIPARRTKVRSVLAIGKPLGLSVPTSYVVYRKMPRKRDERIVIFKDRIDAGRRDRQGGTKEGFDTGGAAGAGRSRSAEGRHRCGDGHGAEGTRRAGRAGAGPLWRLGDQGPHQRFLSRSISPGYRRC